MSAIRYRYRAGLGYGGFSGKARQNRDRARAARWHAERMLDEYADADPAMARGDHFIPIGRISEFLPSAGEEGSEVEVGCQKSELRGQRSEVRGQKSEVRDQRQLDLPLHRQAMDAPGGEREAVQRGMVGSECSQNAECRFANSEFDSPFAIRYPLFARLRPFAGLAYGCAIGGAAAAALLLVIRIAVL